MDPDPFVYPRPGVSILYVVDVIIPPSYTRTRDDSHTRPVHQLTAKFLKTGGIDDKRPILSGEAETEPTCIDTEYYENVDIIRYPS